MAALATWFTPSLSVISRSNGSSSVASAAYRACVKLYDKLWDKYHDYTPKKGQIFTEIFGNFKGSIEELWNAAEAADTRKNSRTAREIMIPLPEEWTEQERKEFSKAVAQMLFEYYGVAGQYSLHAPNKRSKNFHVHILFTTREVSHNEFTKKTRILDEGKKNGEITNLRNRIAEIMNEHAKKNGSDFFVTGGKFVEFDEDHIPTKNIPINATPEYRAALEEENRQIIEMRGKLKKINGDIKNNEAEIQAAITSYEESKEQTRVKKKRISQSVENLSQSAEISLPNIVENVPPVTEEIEHTIIEKSIFVPDETLSPAPVEISKPVLDENLSKKEENKAPIIEPDDILNEAFRLQKVYRENQKAKQIYRKSSSIIDDLKDKLKELDDTKNSIFELIINKLPISVQNFLTVNDPITEREEMRKTLLSDLEKMKARQVKLKFEIYEPDVLKDCLTWECNLTYRNAIDENAKQSPDYKKPPEEQTKIQPVYEVDFNNGMEHVNNPSHTDYSDHPYRIKAPWEDGPKPPGCD